MTRETLFMLIRLTHLGSVVRLRGVKKGSVSASTLPTLARG